MRQFKRMLVLFLICLLPAAGLAEDVCVVEDASSAAQVTTGCSYLRVECPLPGDASVTLSVQDEWGGLIYQRDYGLCSGSFRSRDVYLPLEGDSSRYTVTLNAGAEAYTFAVTRELPMVTDSAVYAQGLSLRELNGGSSRKYAVVLDLDALNGQTAVMPMLSAGRTVGEVSFTVQSGQLTVSASLAIPGRIDKAAVYVAADAITAQTLGTSHFTGTKARLDRAIPLGDAPYAAVMVQLTVTCDPDSAAEDVHSTLTVDTLRETWQMMQMTTANEAVG